MFDWGEFRKDGKDWGEFRKDGKNREENRVENNVFHCLANERK